MAKNEAERPFQDSLSSAASRAAGAGVFSGDSDRLHQTYEKAAEQLTQQYERMVELRKVFGEAARQNVELHQKVLGEMELLKREMERLRRRLKQLGTAR